MLIFCAASFAHIAFNSSKSSPVKLLASHSYPSPLLFVHTCLFNSVEHLHCHPSYPVDTFAVDEGLQLLREHELYKARDCPIFHDTDSEGRGGQ